MGVATPGVLGIKRSLGKGLLEHDEWLALSVAEKGGTRMDIVAAGSAGGRRLGVLGLGHHQIHNFVADPTEDVVFTGGERGEVKAWNYKTGGKCSGSLCVFFRSSKQRLHSRCLDELGRRQCGNATAWQGAGEDAALVRHRRLQGAGAARSLRAARAPAASLGLCVRAARPDWRHELGAGRHGQRGGEEGRAGENGGDERHAALAVPPTSWLGRAGRRQADEGVPI